MRAFASALRTEAEKLATRAAWLDRRSGRLKFDGPAADDLRQTMLTTRRAVDRAAGELREVANRVLSAAARVETDIADHRRLNGAV